MKIKLILFAGILFSSSFLFSQDQHNVDSIQALLKSKPTDTVQVNCLNRLASEYKNNEPQKALEYANQSLILAQSAGFKKGMANSYHILGMINSYQSKNDKALEYYLMSLRLNQELGNKRAMSTSYNNIGLIYWNQGNYEKALKYYLISLEIDEQLNEQKGMASSYNNVGLIYWAQNNLDKANEYFQKSVLIYSKLKDDKGMGGAYSNIGGVAYYKGKKDVAILYFKKSYDYYKGINFKTGCATTLTNMSEILTEQKKYAEALTCVTEAIEIHKQLGNKTDMAYGLLAVAKNHQEQKQFAKAIEKLEEAITVSKEANALKQLSQAYLMMANVHGLMNNFSKAYEFHQKYSATKDSIFTNESSAQIAEMNTKYDSDKKNKEIELLKKEKEIQSITQAAEQSRSAFIRNTLIGGCVVVLLVALLLYSRNKEKQKANTELALKNQNINEQKEQIELKNMELGIKNKEITDSIKYAKRLQEAILPPNAQVKKMLPDSFVLYKPKDIVSGDFYFVEEWGGKIFVAAVDCTGHGVPGAFMSIVGYNLLNQALNVYGLEKPFLVLNSLNKNISKMLHQSEEESTVKDGMDICLISIDPKKKILEYAGAFNPLWIIRNNELIELKADKFPVGAFVGEDIKNFSHQEFQLLPGDMVYLFTDGYADQFGGPSGKKFKYKQLQSMLIENSGKPVEEQRKYFDGRFEDWKGRLEQIDDILLIGIAIKS